METGSTEVGSPKREESFCRLFSLWLLTSIPIIRVAVNERKEAKPTPFACSVK